MTLELKCFDWKPMEQYYAKQASPPHFSGYYRQRGIGFDALAAGTGRVVIPFAGRVIVPAAKKIGQRTFDVCSARTDWCRNEKEVS